MMKPGILIVALAFSTGLPAQKPPVGISFSPQSDGFADATREYQAIWATEASRVIEAMERVSGLEFPETRIEATVFEGVSRSGSRGSPMMMRASYPADTKKATLIHELGHRHLAQLRRRPGDIDEHRLLFLILYDIWVALYGERFADEQVAVEKKRRGVYDYEAAWNWALALSKEERATKFAEIRKQNAGGQE
jgi:hypothetical protein